LSAVCHDKQHNRLRQGETPNVVSRTHAHANTHTRPYTHTRMHTRPYTHTPEQAHATGTHTRTHTRRGILTEGDAAHSRERIALKPLILAETSAKRPGASIRRKQKDGPCKFWEHTQGERSQVEPHSRARRTAVRIKTHHRGNNEGLVKPAQAPTRNNGKKHILLSHKLLHQPRA
jgi:hypothetical protein